MRASSPSVELGPLSSSMTIRAQTESVSGQDVDQSEQSMLRTSLSVHKLVPMEEVEHIRPSNRRPAMAFLGQSRSMPEGKLPKSKSFSQLSKPEAHKFPVVSNRAGKRINRKLEGQKTAAQTADGNFLQNLTFYASTAQSNGSAQEPLVEQELADLEESEIERQFIMKRLYYDAVQSPPGQLQKTAYIPHSHGVTDKNTYTTHEWDACSGI
jgi:hypothetical protein